MLCMELNQHPPTTCNESLDAVSAVKNKRDGTSIRFLVVKVYCIKDSCNARIRVAKGMRCPVVASMSMTNWHGMSFCIISYNVACLCARKAWCSMYMLW